MLHSASLVHLRQTGARICLTELRYVQLYRPIFTSLQVSPSFAACNHSPLRQSTYPSHQSIYCRSENINFTADIWIQALVTLFTAKYNKVEDGNMRYFCFYNCVFFAYISPSRILMFLTHAFTVPVFHDFSRKPHTNQRFAFLFAIINDSVVHPHNGEPVPWRLILMLQIPNWLTQSTSRLRSWAICSSLHRSLIRVLVIYHIKWNSWKCR